MSHQTFNAAPVITANLAVTAGFPNAKSYFDELNRLIVQTRVTTASGGAMTLDQGMEATLELIESVKASGKKIMVVGNGGSAAIASHQVIDFWKAGGIKAVSFNDSSQLTCLGNDFGYEHIFSKPVEMFGEPGDMLLAISSSGRSPSITNAADAARRKQCSVVTFSGFEANNPLRAQGDINFYMESSQYGFVEVGHLALIHYLSDVCKFVRSEH